MLVSEQYLFISERKDSQILVFDLDLDYAPVKIFGWGCGNAADQFHGPFGMALFKGFLLVADQNNHRLQIIDVRSSDTDKWRFSGTFGSLGSKPNQFDAPVSLCVSDDKLYVYDVGNEHLQSFECALDKETLQIQWRWTTKKQGWIFIHALPPNIQKQTGATLIMSTVDEEKILRMSSDGKSLGEIDSRVTRGESFHLSDISSEHVFIPNYRLGRILVFDILRGYVSHFTYFRRDAQNVQVIDGQFLLTTRENTLTVQEITDIK
jgi:hypothetical protein